MTPEQTQALGKARALIERRGLEGVHQVAAAVVTTQATYLGLNLECRLPRATICAEASAIAQATLAEARPDIRFCVAVDLSQHILPPCGACRELLADFAPDAEVAAPGRDGEPVLSSVSRLLPNAYKARERGLGC